MTINFRTAKGRNNFFAFFAFNGHLVQKYLPYRLEKPTNLKKNRVSKQSDADFINDKLHQIEQFAKKTYLGYPVISKGEFKQALEQFLSARPSAPEAPKSSTQKFFDAFQVFIDQAEFSFTGRGKKAPKTIATYRQTMQKLKDLEQATSIHPTFETMDLKFFSEWTKFVMKGVSQNTWAKLSSSGLKVFLNWAVKNDYPVNPKYKFWEVRQKYIGVDFLEVSQIRQVQQISLEGRMDYSRDIFLLMCYTGMHIGDALKFSKGWIKGDYIRFKREKTDNECIVPFFDDAVFQPVSLMKKYWLRDVFFADISSNEVYNDVVKIGEVLELPFRLIPKIGRKTFVTYMIHERRMEVIEVMKATGHNEMKSFMKYLGTNVKTLIENHKRNALKVING